MSKRNNQFKIYYKPGYKVCLFTDQKIKQNTKAVHRK